MRRKLYNKLLEWKNESQGKTALLIEGARRVGKSYIAEEFAKENYKSYIIIDFSKVNNNVKDLFEQYLDDLDTFFMLLSAYFSIELYSRESLIILDEVQLFPRARSAIKHLVADGRYDYIETGSLISIKENIKDILIPSEEEHIKMYPFDFEEFLWAIGDTTLMPAIRKMFESKKPLGQLLHRKAMNIFRQYMLVGGMPQAVNTFIETKDFNKVDKQKRLILDLYKEDIAKNAGNYSIKIRNVFDQIPSQLQKHEKKFKLSSVEEGAKFRDYDDAILWLNDSMIVNNAFNTTEPTIGLKMNTKLTSMKCYMGDTGLLISHTFDAKGIMSEEIYKKILFDKLEFNEGMFMENIVAQLLVASNNNLYFYSNSSRNNSENRMEIDFLIQKSKITNRHNISPIEVKSGKNYTTISLKKFIKKYASFLDMPYIIHTNDFEIKDGITYLPVYMTQLLSE